MELITLALGIIWGVCISGIIRVRKARKAIAELRLDIESDDFNARLREIDRFSYFLW